MDESGASWSRCIDDPVVRCKELIKDSPNVAQINNSPTSILHSLRHANSRQDAVLQCHSL